MLLASSVVLQDALFVFAVLNEHDRTGTWDKILAVVKDKIANLRLGQFSRDFDMEPSSFFVEPRHYWGKSREDVDEFITTYKRAAKVSKSGKELSLCNRLDPDMSEKNKVRFLLWGLRPNLVEKAMFFSNETVEELLDHLRNIETGLYYTQSRESYNTGNTLRLQVGEQAYGKDHNEESSIDPVWTSEWRFNYSKGCRD
ncbi:hypothetical protein PR048_001710 [Dryococelus australis]|uniref:Uncharacterized protein n=1 Tax=Dryococelus australis TaxID=614101 RepID=A0ABQ9II99_9NEOP|nr:hypothetical protein PR048_001710 [Dryococelus australis]